MGIFESTCSSVAQRDHSANVTKLSIKSYGMTVKNLSLMPPISQILHLL